jgi:hypothetical protein
MVVANNPNKPTAKDLCMKAIAGIGKHFAGATSLTLMGASFTPASLKAVFQADIDATNATEAGHTQWRQQVATQKATRANTRAVSKALKSYVVGTFGASAVGVLEDFGFSAPKSPGKKTVAAKAEGLVKAKATRAARHTMGKKQRKTVKGTPAATPTVTSAAGAGPGPTQATPAKSAT